MNKQIELATEKVLEVIKERGTPNDMGQFELEEGKLRSYFHDVIEAYQESRSWIDISEAPRDGTEVLLYAKGKKTDYYKVDKETGEEVYEYKDSCLCSGYYDNYSGKGWYKYQDGEGYEYQECELFPTHFQHIQPPKPTTDKTESEL